MFTIKRLFNFNALIAGFFVVANFIDNQGLLWLKWPSFFFFGCLLFNGNTRLNSAELRIILFLLVLLVFNIFVTVINFGNLLVAIHYNTFIFSVVLFLIVAKKINIEWLVSFYMNTLYFLSFGIIFGNLFSLFYPQEGIISFLRIFAMNFDTYEGFRTSGFLGPKIYFHYTLFLPGALGYFLFSKCYFKSFVLFLAVVLSFSRGAIFTSFLIIIIWLLFSKDVGSVIKVAFIFLSGLVLTTLVSNYYPRLLDHMGNVGLELSSGTRNEQVMNILTAYENNPSALFWGFGAGTPLFSTYLNEYVWNIEVAPLELIRKYGLFFGGVLLVFPIYVMVVVRKRDKSLFYALLALFVATFTNPIFTSPMFILIFILSYLLPYETEKKSSSAYTGMELTR